MSGAANRVFKRPEDEVADQQQSQPVQAKAPSMQSFLGKMGGRPPAPVPGTASNIINAVKNVAPQAQLPMKQVAGSVAGAANVFQRPAPQQNVFQRVPMQAANVFQRQPVQQAQPSAVSRVTGMFGGRPQQPQSAIQRAGALISDEDEKQSARDADEKMEAFLGKITNNQYVYKDPSKDGAEAGVNYGPMAQDFEKSDIGRRFVRQNDEGSKMVDAGPRLTLVNTAAAANLNQRLKRLEDEEDDDS